MAQVFHVGMADCAVSKHPANLVTLGLGSCIGLVIFDPTTRTAGLVHIMLPDSHGAKNLPKEGKFADTAVPFLLEQLYKLGVNKTQLKAKMAGGSQMFSMPGKENSLFAVGSKNAEVTTALLNSLGIKILASDTG
ncbi:MAG: chemotaxis protein CheD, partial [Synergistaceae bacterium]|nr:chemotaxis protein CheD [Synergistaceae bacterium]